MVKKFLLTILLILTLSCGAVFASIENLKFNGFIADEAGKFEQKTVKKINHSLKDIKKKTGITVAVIMLKSLDGQSIESVGQQISQNIKIIEPRKGYSIILLLTDEEKLLHIVVGNELGGLTNIDEVSDLIKTEIIPSLQRNEFDNGIINFAELIIKNVAEINNPNMVLYGSIPAYGADNSFNWHWFLLIPIICIAGFAGWYLGRIGSKSPHNS